MRGEDSHLPVRDSGVAETPPRAWGRQEASLTSHRAGRNTPTCVGKTVAQEFRTGIHQKHPHVRGEDRSPAGGQPPEEETPPRAWGRLILQEENDASHRNTPTCVGKTPSVSRPISFMEKHPHVRGEDAKTDLKRSRRSETPPRAWGRHPLYGMAMFRDRNTPTCVGKTVQDEALTFWIRKHPHVRGEDTERLFTFFIEPSKQY